MRRVRRGAPRRGPRRSYLANVNPSSISIGNVSRNIRSKLKEIKSYQVPRFNTQGAGYSTPYNEDENTRDFDQQTSYSNPAREQNPQQGARYGSYNRDQREEQESQSKPYYDQAPYGAKQGSDYRQEVVVPAYVARPQGHEEGQRIVREQRDVPDYSDNHFSKVVHLEPDEEYILSTSGNSRKVTTLEKRVQHSPSACVQHINPSYHERQDGCYCSKESGMNVYQVNADYYDSPCTCNCSDVRFVLEAPVVASRPVMHAPERADCHYCSSQPVAEREYGYVVRPSCDDRREKRPRTYNIYIH